MADSSQLSSTQAQRAAMAMTPEERTRKAQELVRYLLIADQKKIMIKRSDIVKNVLKDSSKAFAPLLEDAKAILRNTFGIELTEIKEDKKQKAYVLANLLDNDTDYPHLEWSPEENANTGLAMVVLSLIFMNGNIMVDSLLYSSLRKLGVDVDVPHPQFGDVKKMLTQELVRQGYVEYKRMPDADPPVYEFEWGARARVETTKDMVLKFVCEVYTDMVPEDWKSPFNDAQREKAGREEV